MGMLGNKAISLTKVLYFTISVACAGVLCPAPVIPLQCQNQPNPRPRFNLKSIQPPMISTERRASCVRVTLVRLKGFNPEG